MQGAASGHSRTYRSGGAAQSHSRTYRSTHCYEWTIGQWEQVPKPLVPKTCTTLVPQGTIVAGAVRVDKRCYEGAIGQWEQVPSLSSPRPLQPSFHTDRKLAAQLYP